MKALLWIALIFCCWCASAQEISLPDEVTRGRFKPKCLVKDPITGVSEKCVTKDPSCGDGMIYLNNNCVQKDPVPPKKKLDTVDPTIKTFEKCLVGQVKVDDVCSDRCPNGFEKIDGVCKKTSIRCPKFYERNINGQCVAILECPRTYFKVGGVCVPPDPNCEPGFKWVRDRCVVINEVCPDVDFFLDGTVCKKVDVECPIGTRDDGHGNCIRYTYCEHPYKYDPSTGFCSQTTIVCRAGYQLFNNTCGRTITFCSPGLILYNGLCYRLLPPSPGNDTQPKCEPGFEFYEGKCYKCEDDIPTPPCQETCGTGCCENGARGDVNVNVKINIPQQSSGYSGVPYSIVNHIEPVVNNITNINNITMPITLNNVNENNIQIYTDVQCRDGSIRTVVTRNNETTNGCVDEDVNDDGDEKCCEVLTPRKCQQQSRRWVCSHRRYNYCGSFCIGKQVFLKPENTTVVNGTVTFAPAPGNVTQCQGNGCLSYDCSGCMDGSFNCSSQCYRYPCERSGDCNYLNFNDFCTNAGGNFCGTN